MKVPKLTIEVDDGAGVPTGTLRMRFHDPEVPEELGVFLSTVVGPEFYLEAITPRLLSAFQAKCYSLMRELTDRKILWQDAFYPWSWRLDERALFQYAARMAVRLSVRDGLRRRNGP